MSIVDLFPSGQCSSLSTGHVPAPFIFAAIFDSACYVWQENCGETGSCWIYDSSALSWGMSWVVVVSAGVNIVCAVLSLFLYKDPPAEAILSRDGLCQESKRSTKIQFDVTRATYNGMLEKSRDDDLGNGDCKRDGFQNEAFMDDEGPKTTADRL